MLESMKAWRRELHRFPELSGQEVQTGRRVREMLEETHPDEVRVMAQTGLRFVYRCGKKGAKALALTALELIQNPEELAAIKAEHAQKIAEQ